VRYESADLLVHARLAETGHAVAVLPDLVWETRQPRTELVDLPGRPNRQVYTAVRTGAETRPVLVELRSVLAAVARRQVAPGTSARADHAE